MFLTNAEANADETLSDDTSQQTYRQRSRLAPNPLIRPLLLVQQPSVAATCDNSGTVTFQWQKRAAGTTRYVNVSGATSASLALTGQTASEDGDKYRVKLNANVGALKLSLT